MAVLQIADGHFAPQPGIAYLLPGDHLLFQRLAALVEIIDLSLAAVIPVLALGIPRYDLGIERLGFVAREAFLMQIDLAALDVLGKWCVRLRRFRVR